MKKILLSLTVTLLFYFANFTYSYAQCTDMYPGSCGQPVAICDADLEGGLAIDMTLGVPDGNLTLCAGGTANNITYIAFTAGTEQMSFLLTANSCNIVNTGPNSGAGIQWGLFEALSIAECESTNDYDEIVSDCNASGPNSTIPINVTGLNVGSDYVLFIDGWAGSVCEEMTVELTSGVIGIDIGSTDEPEAIFDGSIFDPPLTGDELCLGGEIEIFVNPPAAPNANLQLTINPPTAQFPTGIIDLPLGTFSTIVEFDTPGPVEICGFAFNCCDSSMLVCEVFDIVPIPDEDLGDHIVCTNVLQDGFIPDGWLGPAIFTDGQHSIDIESANFSCDQFQTVNIIEQPLQPGEFVNLLVCDPNNSFITDICNTTVGGDQINAEVICPEFDMNGCDSVIFATVDFVNVPTVLFDPECVNGMLQFQLGAGLPNPQNLYDITYTLLLDGLEVWTMTSDDWNLFNEFIEVPIEAGQYTVEVSIERFDMECVFVSNTVNASGQGIFPDDPEIGVWNLSPCILDSLTYALSANNDPDNQYIWEITPPGGITIDIQNTEIGINWENADPNQVYTICVESDNGCATSDPVCQDVQLIAQPDASFNLPDSVCLNTDVVIQYDGTSVLAGDYTWNFDGGSIDAADSNSPGPFNLSYSTTGTKFVSVIVSSGACTSEIFVDSIIVVDELALPVVTCNSETNMVEFTWPVIAEEYIVNPTSFPTGATFVQSDGSFVVTGLNPNDEIVIELTAVDNGVCNDVVIVESCIAQNCPPVQVEIGAVMPICLDAAAAAVDLSSLASIDPIDAGGVIEWSGTGIVNSATGLFDPTIAGAGNHSIVLDYSVGDCPYNASINIEVQQQPISTFTATDTICLLDNAQIVYTGTFSSGDFTWNFDGGNATGSGAAPFDISWDTPGLKTVELTVDNDGCTSEVVSVDVLVQDTLQPVIIECVPNTNDITFNWNDVANTEGYLVTINGVEIGVQTETTYFVDGLVAGNVIDISVVAISSSFCPDVSDFVSCTALNCPPVIVTLATDDTSICLDQNTTSVQVTSDIVGGNGDAILTWIGANVDQTGLFDPIGAGVGTHDVILQYDDLGCLEFDTISITVVPAPIAMFETSEIICI